VVIPYGSLRGRATRIRCNLSDPEEDTGGAQRRVCAIWMRSLLSRTTFWNEALIASVQMDIPNARYSVTSLVQ